MVASSAKKVAFLAVSGAAVLFFIEAYLPPAGAAPAALGAGGVLLAAVALLRALGGVRTSILAVGAAALGFLCATALPAGQHPWPFGFAVAWLPLLVFLLSGTGRDRLVMELSQLEDALDHPARRPLVLARALQIRDSAHVEARRLDPDASRQPAHVHDPRSAYAYAAQVVGLTHALEGRYPEAVAALAEVPPRWMPTAMRGLVLSNLSHWQLCAGDVEGAQRTLVHASDQATPREARPILRHARAAVLVRTGFADAALDLIGKQDCELAEPMFVRQRYRVTRAHAFAAKGDMDGARSELRRVLADAGAEELRRWLPAGGPALPAMRELVAD